jgi:mRNA interferase ChpB
MRIPDRGDIWFANLNPSSGREQQGLRPVVVISRKAFNRMGICIICPISQGGMHARLGGFTVNLMGTGSEIQGVVLCNQIRAIDIVSRGGRYVETLNADIVDEVSSRVQAIVE